LTALPATYVEPPLIAECPVNLECKVVRVVEVGDHDTFMGKVVAAHVDDTLLDEEGRICVERLDTICFMFGLNFRGEYWSLGEKLSEAWYTRDSGKHGT
jgi:flavin reductase (DIM6/NTAB) family NADH-FMN oxidoreductase RutF